MGLRESINDMVQKFGVGPLDPIDVMQRGLDERCSLGIEGLQCALTCIIRDELWARGHSASFAHFVVAARPVGLGLHTIGCARILRNLLTGLNYYAEWGLVLVLIRRPPGHPTTFVNDEGYRRFYTISTATTSVDRMLWVLYRDHQQLFARLQAREITFREATKSLRPSRTEALQRFCDKLSEDERWHLASDWFSKMPAAAQRDFVLANLDVVPDADLVAALKHRRAANSGA